jgi:hypothetical protein
LKDGFHHYRVVRTFPGLPKRIPARPLLAYARPFQRGNVIQPVFHQYIDQQGDDPEVVWNHPCPRMIGDRIRVHAQQFRQLPDAESRIR